VTVRLSPKRQLLAAVVLCIIQPGCQTAPRSASQKPSDQLHRCILDTVWARFGTGLSELAVVRDLDGDGTDELVLGVREQNPEREGSWIYGMEVRTHDGSEVIADFHLPADQLPGDHAALDVDRDDTLEVVVSYVTGDSLYLGVFECWGDRNVTTIPIFGKEDSPTREGTPWTPGAHPRAVLDCNGDKHPEILCIGGCGYWLRPRGVWAVDWHSRKVLWHFPTGAVTSALQLVPDRSDTVRIVCSTYAADNGAECNGTDDFHSYIIVLDQYGRLVRIHDLGKGYCLQTRLRQLRVAPDSAVLVSVTASGDLDDPVRARITRWSGAADSVIGWTEAEFTDTDVLKADVDGNGTEELILATHLGKLRIYDAESARIETLSAGQGRLEARAVGDLDGDGRPEVAVGRGKGCLVVQPQTGEVLAFRRLHDPRGLVRHGRKRAPTLLALSSSGWTQLELRKNPRWVAAGTVLVRPEGVAAGALLLLAAAAGLAGMLSGWTKTPPLCRSPAMGQALVDRGKRVVKANAAFSGMLGFQSSRIAGRALEDLFAEAGADDSGLISRKLSSVPGTWHTLDLQNSGDRRTIRLRMGNAPSGRRPALALVEAALVHDHKQGHRLPWTAVAPRVAHDLKSPISTLALATERALHALGSEGKTDARLGQSLQAILRQVDRVELLARNFLKISELEEPSMALVEMEELLPESLSELRDRIPEHVTLDKRIEAPLPVVWGDREQLLVVLDNLYDNSIAAIGERGSLIVSAYRVSAIPGTAERIGQAVALEVADTGVGIQAADLGRIFNTGFSRKPRGSGLGLAIVKRVIDQHHGHIEVHSEPEVGTTVTIYLPAARRDQ
jgi:nitrogen-specific signal transduction histidine kinase